MASRFPAMRRGFDSREPLSGGLRDPLPSRALDPYPSRALDPYPSRSVDPYPARARDPYSVDPYPARSRERLTPGGIASRTRSPIDLDPVGSSSYGMFPRAARFLNDRQNLREEDRYRRAVRAEFIQRRQRIGHYVAAGLLVAFIAVLSGLIYLVIGDCSGQVGFSGVVNVTECDSNPCGHNGTCTVPETGGFYCTCDTVNQVYSQTHYYGKICSRLWDPHPDIWIEPDSWIDQWYEWPVVYYSFDKSNNYTLVNGASLIDGKVGKAAYGPNPGVQVEFDVDLSRYCFPSPAHCERWCTSPEFCDTTGIGDKTGGVSIAFWLRLDDPQADHQILYTNPGIDISTHRGDLFWGVANRDSISVEMNASPGVWQHWVLVFGNDYPTVGFRAYLGAYKNGEPALEQWLDASTFTQGNITNTPLRGGISNPSTKPMGAIDELFIFEVKLPTSHIRTLYHSYL